MAICLSGNRAAGVSERSAFRVSGTAQAQRAATRQHHHRMDLAAGSLGNHKAPPESWCCRLPLYEQQRLDGRSPSEGAWLPSPTRASGGGTPVSCRHSVEDVCQSLQRLEGRSAAWRGHRGGSQITAETERRTDPGIAATRNYCLTRC